MHFVKYYLAGDKRQLKETLVGVLTGYTLIECEGMWKGESEPSFIVEVFNIDGLSRENFCHLASQLAEDLKQDEVLFTINGELYSADLHGWEKC